MASRHSHAPTNAVSKVLANAAYKAKKRVTQMSNSFFVVPPGIEPGTQGQFIDNVSPLGSNNIVVFLTICISYTNNCFTL